ncbi:signal peptidase I [bacterium]|nr:signal peptidase I [bacterium]
MSITERLATLNIYAVIGLVIILIAVRFVFARQRFAYAKILAEIAESLALAIGIVFLLIRPFLAQAFYIPSASMVPTFQVNDRILVNKLIYRVREPMRGDVVVFKSPRSAGHDGADYIKRVIAIPGDSVRVTAGYALIGHIPFYHDDLRDAIARCGKEEDECSVKLDGDKIFANGKLVSKTSVAAAMGKPGASVKIVPGRVYLNGKPLDESYTSEDADQPYPNELTPRDWVGTDRGGKQIVKIPKGRLLVMGDNRNFSDDSRRWGLLDRRRVQGKAMFIFWPFNRIQKTF